MVINTVQAKPPFIEHKSGFFEQDMLLNQCLQNGNKVFDELAITVKKSTNPENEVVGFTSDYKVVLYCVSEEGGCDAPADQYASGGTVIVAGTEYKGAKKLVEDVLAAMKLVVDVK